MLLLELLDTISQVALGLDARLEAFAELLVLIAQYVDVQLLLGRHSELRSLVDKSALLAAGAVRLQGLLLERSLRHAAGGVGGRLAFLT